VFGCVYNKILYVRNYIYLFIHLHVSKNHHIYIVCARVFYVHYVRHRLTSSPHTSTHSHTPPTPSLPRHHTHPSHHVINNNVKHNILRILSYTQYFYVFVDRYNFFLCFEFCIDDVIMIRVVMIYDVSKRN